MTDAQLPRVPMPASVGIQDRATPEMTMAISGPYDPRKFADAKEKICVVGGFATSRTRIPQWGGVRSPGITRGPDRNRLAAMPLD